MKKFLNIKPFYVCLFDNNDDDEDKHKKTRFFPI